MQGRWISSSMAAALLAASLLGAGAAAARPDQPPDGAHDGFEGEVRSPDECRASGWAIDPDTINRAVTVRVLVDGAAEPVWSGVARLYRADVRDAGYGNGYSGFDAWLMGLITPGVGHSILAQAQDLQTGDWWDLPGSPKLLTCPSSLPFGSHEGAEGTVSADECYAAGWAVDPDAPLTDVVVRVSVDGEPVWTGAAAEFRQDLLDAGVSDGTAAFTLRLGELMAPDVAHSVAVDAQDLTSGEWVALDGTPRTLTCAANHRPQGVHEGSLAVIATPDQCYATGWVFDADVPDANGIPIRIRVDGDIAWMGYPGQFRASLVAHDLPDGASAFLVDLPGLVQADVAHQIEVEAQDVQTGEWHALASTPRTMTCVRAAPNADIYAVTVRTGEVWPVTTTTDAGEFAPDWASKGGTFIADREGYDPDGPMYHRLVLVDSATGVASFVPGSDNANDATVSPNGKWLAFDEYVAYEQYPPFPPCFACDLAIFLMPTAGGTPVRLADNAFTPDWSPKGDRLVFGRPGDDTIWTIDLSGHEVPLGVTGLLPAWSPDGHWIAYSWLGDLWKIAVDGLGRPVGSPIQLTSGDAPFANNDFDPAWSPSGDTIYFTSQHRGSGDAIWSLPAAGGSPTQVTHPAPGSVDTGPAVSRDGKIVLFSRLFWP